MGGESDGGNSGEVVWEEEAEMSGGSPDLGDVEVHTGDWSWSSWGAGELVDHSVIPSAATSVPGVGNPVVERTAKVSSELLEINLMNDALHHGVDLLSLSWIAGQEGCWLVVGIDWHQRERCLTLRVLEVHES